MASTTVTITNRLWLHARAATKLVQTASAYTSSVTLVRDGKEVNGKSILGIMMLAAAQGARIEIRTNGADEDAALAALVELIAARFGEET
jgi:phosphocarrier protein HPr